MFVGVALIAPMWLVDCFCRVAYQVDCFSRVAYQFTHLCKLVGVAQITLLYCWVFCRMIAYKPDHQGSLRDIIKVLCAFNICFIILYLSLCQQV